MYDANSQNTQLRLRTELSQCSYNPNMKDYLANMIMQIMNFPNKTNQARHFIRNMNQDKIIMVWYPMSVPFANKNYNVPLQIYIMKNIPYEPPQIFLEVVQGSAPNPANRDVDSATRRILTNTLRSWSQYSNIENAMNEIYNSFTKVFPIYKTQSKSNPPSQVSAYSNTSTGSGGGIYGVLNNAVQNAYNQQKSAYGAYRPPQTSIYGRSMTSEGNKEQNNSNTFGGGIYNNNNNNNYGGGGIYDQKSNYIPPSSNLYGNNNQNQYGNQNYNQYGNNNNNQYGYYGQYGNNNQYGNNQYGNNNNQYGNNNQYNKNNQYGYNNNNQGQNNLGFYTNPDDDFKNILIKEVSEKISNKLTEENKRLTEQNLKLKEYKTQLSDESEKVQNFVNRQFEIKTKCEEDMSNINRAINDLKDYIDKNKIISLNNENCLSFLDIKDPSALQIIASEASMEDMNLLVKKGFERKKISFSEAVTFMRNSSRDLFTIKFLKNKVIRKYEGF